MSVLAALRHASGVGSSVFYIGDVARGRGAAESLLSGLGLRWDHVRAVGELAESMASGLDVLICAAWLHDVGYAEQVRSTGFHPLDGAHWVRANGYEPSVVSLVAFDTGALVEAEERGLTAELRDFDPPEPELLDMMTFLDMTTGPDGTRVEPADRVVEIVSRYPVDDPVHRAVSRSGAGLIASAERGRLALSQPMYGVAANRGSAAAAYSSTGACRGVECYGVNPDDVAALVIGSLRCRHADVHGVTPCSSSTFNGSIGVPMSRVS